MALAEDGHIVGACRQQRLQIGVFRGGNALAAGGAEGHDLRVLQLHAADALEELHLRRVRVGVARLDEVYAQLVQLFDDLDLVFHRKGDICPLRAVAQGRIEYLQFHVYILRVQAGGAFAARVLPCGLFFEHRAVARRRHLGAVAL